MIAAAWESADEVYGLGNGVSSRVVRESSNFDAAMGLQEQEFQ